MPMKGEVMSMAITTAARSATEYAHEHYLRCTTLNAGLRRRDSERKGGKSWFGFCWDIGADFGRWALDDGHAYDKGDDDGFVEHDLRQHMIPREQDDRERRWCWVWYFDELAVYESGMGLVKIIHASELDAYRIRSISI